MGSWWDDETDELAQRVIADRGQEAVTRCVMDAAAAALREHGHPVDEQADGVAVASGDLKAAIKFELRRLLNRVH